MEKKTSPAGATTRASGQVGTKTIIKNADGSDIINKPPKNKGLPPRGMKLGKHLKKGFDFVKWSGKNLKGYVFKFLKQQKQGCLVCGTPLIYNNSKQMRLYCCKACRWARHNLKYLQTKKGHK